MEQAKDNNKDKNPKKRTDNKFVRKLTEEKYKYGFTTDVHTEVIPVGLNEEVVRLISAKKGEPEWLLDFRLKAYNYWLGLKMPNWAHLQIPEIDYQAISYYADPTKKKEGPKSLDEIDPEVMKTFDKLGIPLEERLALSGGMAVDAVMDSVSENHLQGEVARKGHHLLLHQRSCARIPRLGETVSGFCGELPRQLLCRAQLGRVQ